MPALQYLESVTEKGAADLSGLRAGDYVLEVGTNIPAFSKK